MSEGDGANVVRRQLGVRLKRLREQAGKTLKSVDAAGIFSESKVTRIEKGRNGPVSPGDVWALCRYYDASDVVMTGLTKLAEGTNTNTWWEDEPEVVPEWLSLYIGLEAMCNLLTSYHPELIHGLLQTDDYARAVISRGPHPVDADAAVHVLKLRAERRVATLERASCSIQVVLGPGVFDLVIGGVEVMAQQVDHLKQLNTREGVDIRVVDPLTGAHAGIRGPFIAMDFPDPEDPSVVYQESLTGARYLQDEHQVVAHREIFRFLQQQSMPIEEMSDEFH